MRSAAVWALGELDANEHAAAIVARLEDSNQFVRKSACEAFIGAMDVGTQVCPRARHRSILNRDSRFWLYAGIHVEPEEEIRHCAFSHARVSDLPKKAGTKVGAV